MFRSIYHGCSGNSIQLGFLTLSDINKSRGLIRKIMIGKPIIIKSINIASEASIIDSLLQNDGSDSLLNYLINPLQQYKSIEENIIEETEIEEIKIEQKEEVKENINLWDYYSLLKGKEKEKFNNSINEILDEYLIEYQLNKDQFIALKSYKDQLIYNIKPCLLIHGVFGSGKSYLLGICILFTNRVSELNYKIKKPRILISCMTNTAVDNILLNLLKLDYEEFIRVGSLKRINRTILPYCIQSKKKLEEDIKELKSLLNEDNLSNEDYKLINKTITKFQNMNDSLKIEKIVTSTNVIAVTCLASNFPCLENQLFDILFMDEVSQLTEGLSLLPILKFQPKKLLLVGDPLQLPPTLTNINNNSLLKNKLKLTLFDRLIKNHLIPVMLKSQYRCHPIIAQLSNNLFYNKKLINGINEKDRRPLLMNLPTLCFINIETGRESISKISRSYHNEKEVELIIELITKLVNTKIQPIEIGVICMYKSQVEKIEHKLTTIYGKNKRSKIKVSTVDAFQGAEKSIIILSCVRTSSYSNQFLNNSNRINVALSRAKYHLFIIGNYTSLYKLSIWKSIICDYCKGKGLSIF
ncbi:P-loop containing nucleoside triphosphate hydrolase protein [Neoconidiobolus thromboides FSU 785]|nr:P-loop containing nucleoside triphosphate hydrolase protein [Neoconidiobolus thromboides FSU 785]